MLYQINGERLNAIGPESLHCLGPELRQLQNRDPKGIIHCHQYTALRHKGAPNGPNWSIHAANSFLFTNS
jgi:hypothetical protein